jgi:hypothetical protein
LARLHAFVGLDLVDVLFVGAVAGVVVTHQGLGAGLVGTGVGQLKLLLRRGYGPYFLPYTFETTLPYRSWLIQCLTGAKKPLKVHL